MYSNFDFLSKYWPDLVQIGKAAESYLYSDPNACIFKIGLLSERIIYGIYTYEGLDLLEDTTQVNLVNHLYSEGLLPNNINNIVFVIRKARNKAVHTGVSDIEQAKVLLKLAYNLCNWYMEVYGDWNYVAEDYIEPENTVVPNNYKEVLEDYEKQIKELIEDNAKIKTLASEKSAEERNQRSENVSDNISFSDEEKSILTTDKVSMDISIVPVVNYALQQNKIPLISSIIITNGKDEINEAELIITATPEICFKYQKHIDYIPSNRSVSIKDIDIILNTILLSELTEKVTGCISITLKEGNNTLYSDMIEITALAFDEWHGFSIYPEILSSFVMPNNPQIPQIIQNAGKFLGQWTGDPSFDAYQTMDPNRVLYMAAAVYNAIRDLNISYIVPPASFNRIGQRVRLSDTILSNRMGTCLDLTLFYASCMEAIGINPLLIIKPGHIFAGVWLEDKTFPECIQDDPTLITNRLAEGMKEIAVVECTSLCSGKMYSFDEAQSIANKHFSDSEGITAFLDVKRTRLSNIQPLPIRIKDDNGWHFEEIITNESSYSSSPNSIGPNIVIDTNETMDPITRKAMWERKLLDLGMRNTLINMRFSASLVPLFVEKLDLLEDELSEGVEFFISSKPSDWDMPSNELSFDNMHNLGNNKKIIQSEFENRRLRSARTDVDLSNSLKKLYRSAKLSIEENGANTLYVALGLLKWYETDKSTKPRYAPLMLLPVDLIRQSANRGYKIKQRDDDVQINVTLLEKLKQDFEIYVRGLDPIPMDEHGLDVRKILTIFRKEIKTQPRWDILESAYLGIFSFSQFVMWNDIKNRSEDLERNKIVRSLINNKLEWVPKKMEPNSKMEEEDTYLPIPADASQLYAIQTAAKGESFVLHGPPGTGKSQTITSMIANALANGKSVLFVAEKMAALEVVQKRLESIGIGQFCLELHSNKTNKKVFLEQLSNVIKLKGSTSYNDYTKLAKQASDLRKEINAYVKELHRPLKSGFNIHDMINEYEANAEYPDIDSFPYKLGETLSAEEYEEMNNAVYSLISAARLIGHPSGHPLMMIGSTTYSQRIRNDFKSLIKNYQNSLQEMTFSANRITILFNENDASSISDLDRWSKISTELLKWNTYPRCWSVSQNYSQLTSMVNILQTTAKQEAEIRRKWLPEIFEFSGEELFNEWNMDSHDILATKEHVRTTLDNIQLLCDSQLTMQKTKDELLSMWFESFLSETASELCESLSCPADRIWNLDTGIRDQVSKFYDVAKIYLKAEEMRKDILQRWNEGFLSVETDRILAELDEASKKFILVKSIAVGNVYKEVAPYAKAQDLKDKLRGELTLLKEYQNTILKANEDFKVIESDIRSIYGKRDINWSTVFEDADNAERGTDRKLVSLLRAVSVFERIKIHTNTEIPLDALAYHLEKLKLYQDKKTKSEELLPVYSKILTDLYREKYQEWEKIGFDCAQAKKGLNGFLIRMFHYEKIKDTLKPYLRVSMGLSDYREQFILLRDYQNAKAKAHAIFDKYGEGLDFEELYTNSDSLNKLLEQIKEAMQSFNYLKDQLNGEHALERCGGIAENNKILEEFLARYASLREKKNDVDELLSLTDVNTENWIKEQISSCNVLLEHDNDVKEWITWRNAEHHALSCGLKPVVDAYYNGLTHEQVYGSFQKALFKALLVLAIDNNSVLNTFTGSLFNEKIRKFKEIDEKEMTLAKKEIFYKLASKIPDLQRESYRNSEANILQRAILNKGRGLSIRKMFESLPTLIPRLCPCMLMSPISAAQYLDPNREPFDLVIFDEASQMTTAKAVGVLARGKNAVIVGDPKQMPPTSFFTSTKIDENNLDSEDLESILDDCLAVNMPQTHLLWHYRSRHESLIEFSNTQFYENKLYTFPSVNDRESRVSLVMVDGYFERGRKRHNRAEAEAVVAEIIRRSKDEELRKYSVGVVTFNSSQQELIDDLLSEACAKNAKLEKWVNQSEEPVFIKNLENVQGDERDVILFSIGYGPDENGKISMNFGPLNRDGGWRRLNVAVSRSRHEMKVFSTLKPEKINLSSTRAEGVIALKNFLLFAKQHTVIANEGQLNKKYNDVNGIARSISDHLKQCGYDTQFSVGTSEYRVDIGVVDPRDPDKYLFGVLLDGDSYRNAVITRDREIAQVNILNSLGWKLVRIWSMDWWDNKEKELNRILTFAKSESDELTKRLKKIEEEEADKIKEPVYIEEQISIYNNEELVQEEHIQKSITADHVDDIIISDRDENVPILDLNENEWIEDPQDIEVSEDYEASGESEEPVISKLNDLYISDDSHSIIDQNEEFTPIKEPETNENTMNFSLSDLKVINYQLATTDKVVLSEKEFYDENNKEVVFNVIASIIKQEAPISDTSLCIRVAECFGIKDLTLQFSEYILSFVNSKSFILEKQNRTLFIWNRDQNPAIYPLFRRDSITKKRSINDIPLQEIANAVLIKMQMMGQGFDKVTLARYTANYMKYKSSFTDTEDYISNAIDKLEDRKILYRPNNKDIYYLERDSAKYVLSPFGISQSIMKNNNYCHDKTVSIAKVYKKQTGAASVDNIKLSDLKFLSSRTRRVADRNNFFTIGDLKNFSRKESLYSIKNVGKLTYSELKAAMEYDPTNKIFNMPDICMLRIEELYSDYDLFLKYCRNNKMEYLYQLGLFSFKKLQNIRGFHPEYIGEIYKIFEDFIANGATSTVKKLTETKKAETKKTIPVKVDLDEPLFSIMNAGVYDLPLKVLSAFEIPKYMIAKLDSNGYKFLKDLCGIRKTDLLKMFSESNIEKIIGLQDILSKSAVEMFNEVIVRHSDSPEIQAIHGLSEGCSLESLGDQFGVSEFRIQEMINEFLANHWFILDMIISKRLDKTGYVSVKEISMLFKQNYAKEVVLYWCKHNYHIDYIESLSVLVKADGEFTEDKIVSCLANYIKQGTNYVENQKEIQNVLRENKMSFVTVPNAIMLLQEHGYTRLGQFIVKS